MIVTSVSEFCDSMGYCEMRIKHFLKGIKTPQTEITIEGIKAHEEEELKFNPKPKNMQSLCTKLRDFRGIRSLQRACLFRFER
jgi:hypothetical protein